MAELVRCPIGHRTQCISKGWCPAYCTHLVGTIYFPIVGLNSSAICRSQLSRFYRTWYPLVTRRNALVTVRNSMSLEMEWNPYCVPLANSPAIAVVCLRGDTTRPCSCDTDACLHATSSVRQGEQLENSGGCNHWVRSLVRASGCSQFALPPAPARLHFKDQLILVVSDSSPVLSATRCTAVARPLISGPPSGSLNTLAQRHLSKALVCASQRS